MRQRQTARRFIIKEIEILINLIERFSTEIPKLIQFMLEKVKSEKKIIQEYQYICAHQCTQMCGRQCHMLSVRPRQGIEHVSVVGHNIFIVNVSCVVKVVFFLQRKDENNLKSNCIENAFHNVIYMTVLILINGLQSMTFNLLGKETIKFRVKNCQMTNTTIFLHRMFL